MFSGPPCWLGLLVRPFGKEPITVVVVDVVVRCLVKLGGIGGDPVDNKLSQKFMDLLHRIQYGSSCLGSFYFATAECLNGFQFP